MKHIHLIFALLAALLLAHAAVGQTTTSQPTSAPATGAMPSGAGASERGVSMPTSQTAPASSSRPTAPRPTTAVANNTCTSAECHAAVKDFKMLHGPVNVNACDACHKLSDASKHTYTLARDKKDICTFCHKVETAGMKTVHKPVESGDCLGCHNPHGGKTAKFTRGNTMSDLCKTCHKDPTAGKKAVHGPVAAGACEACHSPHASPNPKLLTLEGKALCVSCHKEMGEQLRNTKVVHKPVATGECSQCHDPHASNYTMQTKLPPLELCTSCHEHDKIKQAAYDAKYKHSIVTKDQACLNCHGAHGGALAKLMKAPPVNVCLKCHDKKIDVPAADGAAGRSVASVSEVLDPAMSKHGPIRENNCGGCHNVHGSDFSRLLTKTYPESFYQSFALEKYDLCFSCHDKQLALTEKGAGVEGLTGFRNGTQNLHFLHVNREKGRNCRACHETHASKQPLHIRENVPYGKWELPINFKKADNGGACTPGCHQEFTYDRKTPVNNHPNQPAATPPTTQAAPTTQK